MTKEDDSQLSLTMSMSQLVVSDFVILKHDSFVCSVCSVKVHCRGSSYRGVGGNVVVVGVVVGV